MIFINKRVDVYIKYFNVYLHFRKIFCIFEYIYICIESISSQWEVEWHLTLLQPLTNLNDGNEKDEIDCLL